MKGFGIGFSLDVIESLQVKIQVVLNGQLKE
jgi:hypothetical protein